MIKLSESSILRMAIKTFGYTSQINKTEEELTELLLAIKHFKLDKVSLSALISEIADVEIMLPQLKMVLFETTGQDIDLLVSEVKGFKMEKLNKLVIKANDGRGKNRRRKR